MNIIELAEQAGLVRVGDFGMKRWEGPSSDSISDQDLEKFAALVAAHERDFIATKWENLYGYDKQGVAEFIRKRANTQGEQHEPT
jgi:hypothetical protein